jgi:hypothetical protein
VQVVNEAVLRVELDHGEDPAVIDPTTWHKHVFIAN